MPVVRWNGQVAALFFLESECMSYEEEDTCMAYEEEDACMSFEEEDTCMRSAIAREHIYVRKTCLGNTYI